MLPLFRAPPTGSTDAAAPKAAPKSAANICNKDTLTRCRACCAAGCGQSAPHNTSLARAYSAASGADTSDSLRCDARSTRRAAGTRAPPQNTRRAHRMRILDARRRRRVSRNGAGVAGDCKPSELSSRPRPRPRYSRGPSLPSSGFDVRRGAGLLQGRASNGPTKGAAIVLARRPSGGAPTPLVPQ